MIQTIIILLVGIFLLYVGLKVHDKECPPSVTVYRYIPRSFKEEQENPVPINDMFGKMFSDPTVGTIASDYRLKSNKT